MPVDALQAVIDRLHEVNPMLGLRGCRLGIIYPEITRMQVRAIFEAACAVAARKGRVMPEVMVPLTASVVEFRKQALLVRQVAEEVFRERQITVPFLLGTMIELPRAALTADELAREAQFFSFGTNDLTQTTWGLSRDDAGHFLPYYIEHGVIEDDPFQVLDQAGVGKLIQMACELGRRTRPDLKLGICGEHGGEPTAVAFCDRLGHELRELLAVPHSDRPAGGGAGGARRAGHHGPHPGDGLGAREDLEHAVLLDVEIAARAGKVAIVDHHVLHRRRDERPPAGNLPALAAAAGLVGHQQRLARLVQAEQMGLDHAIVPMIPEANDAVIEDGQHQALGAGELLVDPCAPCRARLLLPHFPSVTDDPRAS